MWPEQLQTEQLLAEAKDGNDDAVDSSIDAGYAIVHPPFQDDLPADMLKDIEDARHPGREVVLRLSREAVEAAHDLDDRALDDVGEGEGEHAGHHQDRPGEAEPVGELEEEGIGWMDWDDDKLAHGKCFGCGRTEDFGHGRVDKDLPR